MSESIQRTSMITNVTNPMELGKETRPTATGMPKANGGSLLDSSDDVEEGGVGDVNEEQEEKCEESDASSREEGQEWEVDSFDDGFDYRPRRNLDPNDEIGQKMHRYRSSMYKSKGFDVDIDSYPGSLLYRQLFPIDLDEPFEYSGANGLTGREYMKSMVDLALERYNKIKGLTVTCESIVRSIIDLACGLKCYITFMARESSNGDLLVEYQAKTDKRIWQKKTHVIFCRPTPEPKEEPMDVEYSDSTTDGESSDESSRESEQAWDVDSFDEGTDFKPPTKTAPSEEEIEKMRLYRPQMYKNKGFFVDGEVYPGRLRYFSPVDLDNQLYPTGLTGRQYMENMVDVALNKYNEMKEGSKLTLESIVRANLSKVNGFKSYITFMAREIDNGDLVEYQAKVERKFWQRDYHAILCRPSPKSEGGEIC
ncbi:uncharacterized protein LOC125580952 isoform X1 [Brassica napus]|uniref:uncharacterized protein LOC125580952 isoform X1 n=1 Tax=Brassica napus TaxID=3708 RepID=UPI0020788C79|nr:uncharacterized protein LOC125580952 isoform X1 [Brassica napus]